MDENGATYDRMHLRDWFNNPHPLLKADVFDGVLRGLVLANPEASDDHFVSEVFTRYNNIANLHSFHELLLVTADEFALQATRGKARRGSRRF